MRRLKTKAFLGNNPNEHTLLSIARKGLFSFSKKQTAILWFSFLFILAAFPLSMHAQRSTTTGIPWKLSSTVDQVDFYSALVDCGGEKVVMLRFVNRNSKAVKVSWKEVYEVQATSSHSNDLFKQKELTIKPGENALTGCQERYNDLATRSREIAPHFKGNIIKVAFQDVKVSN